MREDDRGYEEAIAQLLRLTSVEDIRTAADELRNMPLSVIVGAFDAREQILGNSGRSAEIELLHFVRDVFMAARKNGAAPQRDDEIRDTTTLLAAAARQPNALCMRTMLSAHRSLLDPSQVYAFASLAVGPRAPAHELRCRIHAAYIAALLLRDDEQIVNVGLLRCALARKAGDPARAARVLRRMKAITSDRPENLRLILSAEAGLYRSLNRFPEALAALRQTRDAFVSSNQPLLVASTDEAIAQCHKALGDYDAAAAAYTAAIETFERYGITDGAIRCLNGRGLTLDSMGLYDRGFADYTGAAAIAKEVRDYDQEFIARNNAAATFLKRGRPREAYREFTDILRDLQRGANAAKIASTYNNLGQCLLSLDQPAAAQSMFGRALSLKANSADKRGETISFLGLAAAAEKANDKQRATTLYSLAMMPILESGDSGSLAIWATRVAGTDTMPTEESIEALLWAAKQTRAGHERQLHLVVASCLFHAYAKRGEEEKAVAVYESVADLRREGADPQIERLDVEYARLLIKHGNCGQALAVLQPPRRNIELALHEIADVERHAEIISERVSVYGALIAALMECDEADPLQAFDIHESAKAPAFLAGLATFPSPAPPEVSPDLAVREAELLARTQNLRDAEPGTLRRRMERLKETRAELEECWAAMSRVAPEYVRRRSGRPYSFPEIANRLREAAPGTAFVSFFCDHSATTAFVFRGGDNLPRVFRCATTSDEWESIAKRLRRTFNGAADEFPPYPPIRRDYPEKRTLEFFDAAGSQLHPVFEALGDATLVCVAPHGPLHLIPFHCFRAPSGDYWIERAAFVYAATISVAVNAIAPRRAVPPRRSAYVAAVAAAEDRNPDGFTRDAEIFDGLPCDLTRHVGKSAATRENILRELPRHDVVHLSCHGFFDSRDAMRSGLLVSNGRSMPPRQPWTCPPFERRDYVITAADLRNANLAADLVTLNACSTALQGQRNAGDELDGFTRSLQQAGAACILVGLWNIDQRSSREFLRSFYRAWLDPSGRLPKWQALRQACLAFIRHEQPALRHPYHWAPFILTGDWR
jgi:CHAT domain-containing protein/tetratricopeptide (TPR) repeat protein